MKWALTRDLRVRLPWVSGSFSSARVLRTQSSTWYSKSKSSSRRQSREYHRQSNCRTETCCTTQWPVKSKMTCTQLEEIGNRKFQRWHHRRILSECSILARKDRRRYRQCREWEDLIELDNHLIAKRCKKASIQLIRQDKDQWLKQVIIRTLSSLDT